MKNRPKVIVNRPKIDLSSVKSQVISTSKYWRDGEQIKMFIISFKIGGKTMCQTRHMTESECKKYKQLPSLEAVSNAQKNKGLQDCHLNLKRKIK